MADFYTLKAISPATAANKPHIFAHSTARSAANDTLAEFWNAATNAGIKAAIDLNGQFYSAALTAGDLLYGVTGGITGVRRLDSLAIGTVNKVLVSTGSAPSWSSTLAGLTLTSPTITGTGAAAFATLAASGLISANAGLTVASGQTLTLTGATVTGLTAASVTAGTFPAGAFAFQGGLSGITTLAMTGALSGATTGAFSTSITSPTLQSGSATTLLLKYNTTSKVGIASAEVYIVDPLRVCSGYASASTLLQVGVSGSFVPTGAVQRAAFFCIAGNSGTNSGAIRALDVRADIGTTDTTPATMHGVHIIGPTAFPSGSSCGSLTGLYVEDQTRGGSTNYAIYTNAGLVRFGDAVTCASTLSAATSLTSPILQSGEATDLLLKYNTTTKVTIGTAGVTFVDPLLTVGANTVVNAYRAWVTGDTQYRFMVTVAGKILWGDGTNAPDVVWERSGSHTMSITGDMTVTGDHNVTSGKVYKVNGTQVLGAQGAAVADATDAASTTARLNDLLARVRAHGLIAT